MNWREDMQHPEPPKCWMIQSCSPEKLISAESTITGSVFIFQIKYQILVQIKFTRFIQNVMCVHVLFIPVSVRGVKVAVWSETSGAGTPHSVQRRLQVAAMPQHGSREREREREMRKK